MTILDHDTTDTSTAIGDSGTKTRRIHRRKTTPDATVEQLAASHIRSHPMSVHLQTLFQERALYHNIPEQRDFVWDVQRQQLLIDTIFRGYPIPPILVNQRYDATTGKPMYWVIDGQQRLGTILAFYDGKFKSPTQTALSRFDPTPLDALEPGRTFAMLSPRLRGQVEGFQLPFTVLDDASDEVLAMLFRRLQSQSVLSAGEILWSYGGKFALCAKEALRLPFWDALYSPKDSRRDVYQLIFSPIAFEAKGIPFSLRLAELQILASPVGDAWYTPEMHERLLRRLTVMAHLFSGTKIFAKSEIIPLYQAVMQLEQAGIATATLPSGCLSPWYGAVKRHFEGVYFHGHAHIISRMQHQKTQRAFWDEQYAPLLQAATTHADWTDAHHVDWTQHARRL